MKGMHPMTLPQSLMEFMDSPTVENLSALRRDIRQAHNFDPMLQITGAVQALMDEGNHVRALEVINDTLPGSLLSPSTHVMASECFRLLGDQDSADREATLADVSVRCVTITGSGTREEPWQALRINDQYDVMAVLGMEPVAHQQYREGERIIDVHTTSQDQEVWFELV